VRGFPGHNGRTFAGSEGGGRPGGGHGKEKGGQKKRGGAQEFARRT